jgi:STE24 endopeptidase
MYRIFVIEDRFGFNRTTLKIFFADKLKGYLLGALIGGSILALFVIFYQLTGKSFWIYLWITISVVMLLTTMFYSSVIVPMFNKLKPLEPGDLRKAIEEYCSKVKFTLSDLFIMDGSKRSTKANAFFSGL